MTDREFRKLLKNHSNKMDFPTSGWVSKTDDKGNKEWNHYRFYDTSSTFSDRETSWILLVVIVGGILGWILKSLGVI